MIKSLTITFLLLLVSFTYAQDTTQTDPFSPINFLVGSWSGEESGAAGIGKGERTYEFVLKNKYLHFKNMSVFEPQEKNPKGEIHEDWGFFSYDNGRDVIVLRQFFGEGYVNQYTLEVSTADTLILVSENLENAPNGMRARYVYIIEDNNSFIESFELAMPGKEFGRLISNKWTRTGDTE